MSEDVLAANDDRWHRGPTSSRRRRNALACHVSPDGDALGSMLALHHVCARPGSQYRSFSEPFVVAPHYRELPGLELLTPPDQFPHEPTSW